jgi:hypothetical protein
MILDCFLIFILDKLFIAIYSYPTVTAPLLMKEGFKSYESENYLGLTTLQCIKRIVSSLPQIETVQLRAYKYIPFMQADNVNTFHLEREEFLNSNHALGEIIRSLEDKDANVTFDSIVKLKNGEAAYLPFMDCALPRSTENLERLKDRFKEHIAPEFGGGYFLETKESYHFIGERLLDHKEWYSFLGSCLTSSIVTVTPEDQPNIHEMICDYRYVGHTLKRQGITGLRLTTKDSKKTIPHVVAKI